jgi:Flp pilus assembly protein protease CpaA
LGTLAAVAVALLTIRRRPLGNALVLAGLAVAATGSALVGLGEAGTAAVFAAAAVLLYLGFSAPAGWRVSSSSSKSDR